MKEHVAKRLDEHKRAGTPDKDAVRAALTHKINTHQKYQHIQSEEQKDRGGVEVSMLRLHPKIPSY